MNKKTSNKLTVPQERRLSRYKKEIRIIVFDLLKSERIESIPINEFSVDKKFQNLKIFVALEENEKNLEFIATLNKKISPIIKSKLVKVKEFSRIPNVIFLIDKGFSYINEVEKLLKGN